MIKKVYMLPFLTSKKQLTQFRHKQMGLYHGIRGDVPWKVSPIG